MYPAHYDGGKGSLARGNQRVPGDIGWDEIGNWAGDIVRFAASRFATIIIILILSVIALRLLRSLVQRIVKQVLESRQGSSREINQRAATLAALVESTGRYVILFIAALMILGTFGISLAPLIASAGIAGIAVAFGAQSLISDTFNGFFILLEGQFGVGDFIRVEGIEGTVEEMSLRRTVIRSLDGAMITIPNSEIRIVENLSKGWSRAVIEIAVAPDAEERQVMEVLTEILGDVHEDPEFAEVVVAPANILGLVAVEPNQLIFRAFIRTRAQQQFALQRELQRRVRARLIEESVPMPPRTIDVLAGSQP
jgi:small-conductance mechanosensitive channel